MNKKIHEKTCKTQIVSFLMCFPIACKHIFSVYLFCSRIKCFVALIRQLLAEHNVCLFFIFGVCTMFSPSRLHSKQSVYLCETFFPSLSFSRPLFVTNSMNARCQERKREKKLIEFMYFGLIQKQKPEIMSISVLNSFAVVCFMY